MTKYHAQPVEIDGIRFASKAEGRRYSQLKLMERAGEICSLVLQPKYPLVVGEQHIATYRGDFFYVDCGTGKFILEDVKGVRTPVYKLKKKLVEALYGISITEVPA